MTIDADIRDQAYQFFIQEAPDLLQVIESELVTLVQERSTNKIHNMMRAAHSLKGGSASVGLSVISQLSHRLEDFFKTLHHEELIIDPELEGLLLQAFDLLRLSLTQQIETGNVDPDRIAEVAAPILTNIEQKFGHFLGTETELPNSIDLGVDIALSIFEVDVAEGLERLRDILDHPQDHIVAGELRAQAEVFSGISELLGMPGLGAIAHATIAALDANPHRVSEIASLAMIDFQAARQAVIEGDRTQGGNPSPALIGLGIFSNDDLNIPDQNITNAESLSENIDLLFSDTNDIFALEDLFSEPLAATDNYSSDDIFNDSVQGDSKEFSPFLDDIFGDEIAGNEIIGDRTPDPQTLEFYLDDVFSEESPSDRNEVSSDLSLAFNLDDPFANPFDDPFVDGNTEISTSQLLDLDDVFVENEANSSLDDFYSDTSSDLFGFPPVVTASISLEESLDDVFEDMFEDTIIQETIQESVPPITDVKEITTSETAPAKLERYTAAKPAPTVKPDSSSQLSVRVNLDRLERMNNLVGELAISRNGLSLQNEQIQETIQELLRRFAKFKLLSNKIRSFSDQTASASDRYTVSNHNSKLTIYPNAYTPKANSMARGGDFDSLELDSYGELYSVMQDALEDMAQIEETVDDVILLSGQSNQTLELQRQMIVRLRDDLMWARMLPLSEVLNRFPRNIRDLSAKHQKPVDLKLTGIGVLVDKAILEKLNDPLQHLLRNAFDHGIEPTAVRLSQNKTERGHIEIRAYHQGSQTVIEVRDDGQGINLERIRQKGINLGLISSDAKPSSSQLLDLMFQPGFSTADRVSELSGRGVGLDVVRSQIQSLKGTVSVNFEEGKGTNFVLRIPLTLTIANLLICIVGASAFALPSDSIEEILVPKSSQVKQSSGQRFLHWREQMVPIRHLSDFLDYRCPLPEIIPTASLVSFPTPEDWASPLLIIRRDQQILALEIDRLVTEQELVIKPFGSAIAPPVYVYGCTILGDGSLIPVLDSLAILGQVVSQSSALSAQIPKSAAKIITQSDTLLIVDDSIALRQTLALTLQKAGFLVLQARDGLEAIEQLEKNSTIQLVVCDVEMPNMNGFEFLTHRRQDPNLKKTPVVMLTSRSSDKHRRLAMHLGASSYFTKPYLEQEFISTLKDIIAQQNQDQPVLATSIMA